MGERITVAFNHLYLHSLCHKCILLLPVICIDMTVQFFETFSVISSFYEIL